MEVTPLQGWMCNQHTGGPCWPCGKEEMRSDKLAAGWWGGGGGGGVWACTVPTVSPGGPFRPGVPLSHTGPVMPCGPCKGKKTCVNW